MCGRGQDYINIELDSNRNQLIRVHTTSRVNHPCALHCCSKQQLRCFHVFLDG